MSVMIVLLRGVNVGGKNMVKMETLRTVCSSLGCTDVQTYVQSGNVVLRTAGKAGSAKATAAFATRLEDAIEAEFGFRVPVVLRTAAELRAIVKADPFPKESKAEPGKVNVTFLYGAPTKTQLDTVRAMTFSPEVMWVGERELVLYFPLGIGQSKMRWGPIDKALGTSGTTRNWNSVLKLLEMAEALG